MTTKYTFIYSLKEFSYYKNEDVFLDVRYKHTYKYYREIVNIDSEMLKRHISIKISNCRNFTISIYIFL